jgi:excisionase family DNA binding protein
MNPHPNPTAVPASTSVERLTYSVAESAHALGVSRATIYRMLTHGTLSPLAGIRHKRIPCQQVRRLVAAAGRN